MLSNINKLGRSEYEYSGSIQLGNVPTHSVFSIDGPRNPHRYKHK